MPPADPKPTVFVVDDNPGIRRSLQALAEAAGLGVVTFAGADEFLAAYDGGDLQDELRRRRATLPIIDFLQKRVPATGLARALGRLDTP
jgi:FixJ family two-component response regulator